MDAAVPPGDRRRSVAANTPREDVHGNDLTLLATTLALSPTERIERFLQVQAVVTEVQAAARAARRGPG